MPTTDLILHHYELSPFSEKMRTLLGYCGMPWHSVLVEPSLPRPELMRLTGGYRRIPVMQIGADIYCDTRLVTRKLAEITNKPALFANDDPAVLERAEWADTRLFQIALTASMGRQIFTNMKGYFTFTSGLRLIWDRIKMARGANMPRIGPKQARQELHAFLQRFETELTQDFAFGDAPTIADFSMYHSLHFSQERCGAGHLDRYPLVLAWLKRMTEFGRGQPVEMTRADSLKIAADTRPAAPTFDAASATHAQGTKLTIRPADYGVQPVSGELVGADTLSWTLARRDDELGVLHVHFPKQGFDIAPA